MTKLSFSSTLPVTNSATAAGTKVSDSTSAAGQGDHDGDRHRVEHLPLDAGEGEDRHIDQR